MSPRRCRSLVWWLAGLLVLSRFCTDLQAQASVFFVTDEQGRVGRWDTTTNTGSQLGTLAASGFAAMQVIGLAYDPTTNSVLLFDRSANRVYSMNALTGVTTVLFSTPGVQLQGGAVLNDVVYAINEGTQKLVAYSKTGTLLSTATSAYPSHLHNLGLIPGTGELFTINGSNGAAIMNLNGTPGPQLLSSSQTGGISPEDVDYFNGSFLVAKYETSLTLMNSTTGSTSTFLTSTQLSSIGVTGSVSGVAVQTNAVPEPATWALLAAGGLLWGIRRRRQG